MGIPKPGARARAVIAALTAASLLVTTIALNRRDLVGVALALLCLLSVTVMMVLLTAARQEADMRPVSTLGGPGQPAGGLYGVDADTLESLDHREAVRALRERHRGRAGSATRERG